jgi:spermidine synthase
MRRPQGSLLPPHAFVLGIFSLLAQSLLVREFFVVFSGSELTLGLVLASWLLLTGAGSLAGGRLLRSLTPGAGRLLPFLEPAALFTLPAAILMIRLVRLLAPGATGEILSIRTTALFACTALGGTAFASGLWFTVAAALTPEERSGPGRVYAWEAAGALLGGAFFSFVLADRVEGLQLALALALLSLAAPLGILVVKDERRRPPAACLAAVLAGALTLALLPSSSVPLVRRSQSWRWPGMEVVASRDTRYGNLTLVAVDGQKTMYQNGVPGSSFPDPLAAPETVHLPLLAASSRKNVLLVGGMLGGGLSEVLRYPVERVDYLELDPEMLGMVRDYLPGEYAAPLDDPRVRLLHIDGRAWLRRQGEGYDVILLNLPPPATALINRFYTREFFLLARRSLNAKGLLALSLPASPNYFGEALRLRNGSVFQTLSEVFPFVAAVPAGRNIFLATLSSPSVLSQEHMAKMVQVLGVESTYLKPEIMASLLDPGRSEFLRKELTAAETARNSDASPAAYFTTALYRSVLSDPSLSSWLGVMRGPARLFPFFLPVLLLLGGTAAVRILPGRGIARGAAAISSGFSGMTSQYLILFTYQTARGILYRQIGVLNGAFMAGLAAGGFLCLAMRGARRHPRRLLVPSETALLLWPLLLAAALQALLSTSFALGADVAVDAAFLALSSVSGILVGFQFPLFVLAHQEKGRRAAALGGRYYFLDLAGSALGVLLASVWLLPLLGIWGALGLCFALKSASLVVVLVSRSTASGNRL